MTTIAFDGRTIAFDKQITSEHGAIDNAEANKMIYVGDNQYLYAGGSGSLDAVQEFQQWMIAGAIPGQFPRLCYEESNNCTFVAIANRSPRELVEIGRHGRVCTYTDKPEAVGSGSEYAQGALLAGATAEEAVKIAAQCDAFTGSDISVIDL